MRPETRAIVVNFPHNPTGAQLDRASFARLVDLAEGAGATLFSDEVYRFAGLRIGWVASRDRNLLARLAAFKDYTTICSSAPSEVLSLIALRALDHVVERSRSIVAANMALLDDFFERRSEQFEWVRPTAGPIGFPKLVSEPDVEPFCADLVREAGVLLLPGAVYGHPGNHFRIGFGRRNLPEALERLDRFIDGRPRAGSRAA